VISLRSQRIALALILILGLFLRLKGIHNPLLDHPGWRQGDEAAIARNFAMADLNPLHPQADYNGPGPNYVELELQIVPWIAALGYKLFGVHEIFGRLISIAASLGTVGVLYAFGRYIFLSPLAGLGASLLYAIAPGAMYYGRTFQPDTTMAFFLTCALFAGTRMLLDENEHSWRRVPLATVLLLAALLAKSVAIVAVVPLFAVSCARFGLVRTLIRWQTWVLLLGAILPFIAYDYYEQSIAEWKWASGITKLHVIPSLIAAFTSPHAFIEKLSAFIACFTMLSHTMLGPVIFTLLILAFLSPLRGRAPVMLVAWLAADLAYAYAVVTVERVDYYLYPFVPLAALAGGAYLASAFNLASWREGSVWNRRISVCTLLIALTTTVLEGRSEIAAYYEYNPGILHQAQILDRVLPPDAIIVQGHLDPSLLYYIHRRGWEEDPYLWTPFDEQSAIHKGARYFVAAEPTRLEHNVELSAWLKRFPLLELPPHSWPVYVTDPDEQLPNAEQEWKKFRLREKQGGKIPPMGV
jgi:hypothetical protein